MAPWLRDYLLRAEMVNMGVFITEYGIVSELIFNGPYRYSLSKKDILEEDLIMPKKYNSILTDNIFIASLCDLISRAY